MQALKEIHGVEKEEQDLKFGIVFVSTERIEEYVMKHQDGMFGGTIPRLLTERIRQAARRLVGIPDRGGDTWQVIALEEIQDEESGGEMKWVRRRYAPDRGSFTLGLMRKGTETMEITEVSKCAQQDTTIPHEDILDGEILLNGRWAEKQRATLRQQRKKKKGWSDLLSQNKETIEALTAQRNNELGL
jgi:hypothetical protein